MYLVVIQPYHFFTNPIYKLFKVTELTIYLI
jgi:hypothetical protein